MTEEFDTDQLVEFCQHLGLANDGYLDEKDLVNVCGYIGLQAPEEMLKELFEELDSDKDGRVCLNELSQMLRGMPKGPPSPEKLKKLTDTSSTSPPVAMSAATSASISALRAGFSNTPNGDRCPFSILDPHNSGFTKVGMVIDMWSQLGISQGDGIQILKDMGFPATSRNNSFNVQDLNKALEEETDNSKDALPLVVQTALLTYRTETQYLRSICESFECERDKLRLDILEAHQRSSMLAQEVDEQNTRLEKNSQILLKKVESKYAEQIQELQQKFAAEKESLQQTLLLAESQLTSLQNDDAKLKSHIAKLNDENCALERELQNLNREIRDLNRTKTNFEKEISRYVELENRLIDMERRSAETIAVNEAKLQTAYGEVQLLRDQNDEVSSQLEGMKETVKVLKAFQEKRFHGNGNKKRKGSKSLSSSEKSDGIDECNDHPLEKIGKFQRNQETNMFSDDLDLKNLESSIDPLLTSCSQPDSGNFPVSVGISLAACMGESCTDSPYPERGPSSFHLYNNDNLHSSSEYKTLETEMETVKEKIVTIISEKEHLMQENRYLKNELGGYRLHNHGDSVCHFGSRSTRNNIEDTDDIQDRTQIQAARTVEIFTQTSEDTVQSDMRNTDRTVMDNGIEELRNRIAELECEANQAKLAFEREKNELKDQCCNLENSLELLRVEYEKCEDYWHDKLQEAREIYEQDKAAMDDRFQDLAIKISEYEEAFLPNNDNEAHANQKAQFHFPLPPIEERASLEKQVTDLEEECEGLRNELQSLKVEQDSVISNYQRQLESRAMEECGRLEQQVCALSNKCKEYESRLSSLAEEEQSTLEENGMMNFLKDRVRQLEFQTKNQEEKLKLQITQLERVCKEKEEQLKRATSGWSGSEIQMRKTTPSPQSYTSCLQSSSNSPQPPQPQPLQLSQTWNNDGDLRGKSRSLLEMLQQSNVVADSDHKSMINPMLIWPQRYSNATSNADKSSSLPYFPFSDQIYPCNDWGTLGQHQQDPWMPPEAYHAYPGKKAWCHVELGWLQALRLKLKQRDNQCYGLQRVLQQKEMESEKLLAELRYKHEAENSNWESLMHASQELVRQQAVKHKEQAEKLAHSDLIMKDLWVENSKLMAALNATEQRVLHLENLLKRQMQSQVQGASGNQTCFQVNPNVASPRSLQFPPHHENNFSA